MWLGYVCLRYVEAIWGRLLSWFNRTFRRPINENLCALDSVCIAGSGRRRRRTTDSKSATYTARKLWQYCSVPEGFVLRPASTEEAPNRCLELEVLEARILGVSRGTPKWPKVYAGMASPKVCWVLHANAQSHGWFDGGRPRHERIGVAPAKDPFGVGFPTSLWWPQIGAAFVELHRGSDGQPSLVSGISLGATAIPYGNVLPAKCRRAGTSQSGMGSGLCWFESIGSSCGRQACG